jgi:hypothetical protein
MSILHRRIMSQHYLKPMGSTHPHGTGATPMTMPLAQVTYRAGGAGVSYEDMHVIWSADGAPYAALATAPWGGVVPAGQP